LRLNREPLRYEFKIFGLKLDRDKLYKNIDDRVEQMFKRGIVEEVRRLSKRKLSITAQKALGHSEVLGYLKGSYSLDEAKALLKKHTRHFARRQLTWFRPDKRICWVSSSSAIR
jgi:tRNA dimethylallyltransferase